MRSFCSSEHEVFAFLPAHHIFWSKQDEIKVLMFCLLSRGFYGLSTDQLSWRTNTFLFLWLARLKYAIFNPLSRKSDQN